jgi:hypothetical protein
VWKRLCAFGLMQKGAPALSSDRAASSQQQVDMYSTLTLALPEDDLSIIENVSEDDKTCGHSAWTALVNHYENDGSYRCTKLLHDSDTPQADCESGNKYLNRLVRLQLIRNKYTPLANAIRRHSPGTTVDIFLIVTSRT